MFQGDSEEKKTKRVARELCIFYNLLPAAGLYSWCTSLLQVQEKNIADGDFCYDTVHWFWLWTAGKPSHILIAQ